MNGSFDIFKNQYIRNGGYYENFKICFDRSLYGLLDSKSRQIPGLVAALFAQPVNDGFMDHSLLAFVGDINFNGALSLINGNPLRCRLGIAGIPVRLPACQNSGSIGWNRIRKFDE
jgi:hypothetical protein